jgi:hypothetical protein
LIKTLLKFFSSMCLCCAACDACYQHRTMNFDNNYSLHVLWFSSAYDCIVPSRGKAVVKTDIQIALPDGCYGRVGKVNVCACVGFIFHIAKILPRSTGRMESLIFSLSSLAWNWVLVLNWTEKAKRHMPPHDRRFTFMWLAKRQFLCQSSAFSTIWECLALRKLSLCTWYTRGYLPVISPKPIEHMKSSASAPAHQLALIGTPFECTH